MMRVAPRRPPLKRIRCAWRSEVSTSGAIGEVSAAAAWLAAGPEDAAGALLPPSMLQPASAAAHTDKPRIRRAARCIAEHPFSRSQDARWGVNKPLSILRHNETKARNPGVRPSAARNHGFVAAASKS